MDKRTVLMYAHVVSTDRQIFQKSFQHRNTKMKTLLASAIVLFSVFSPDVCQADWPYEPIFVTFQDVNRLNDEIINPSSVCFYDENEIRVNTTKDLNGTYVLFPQVDEPYTWVFCHCDGSSSIYGQDINGVSRPGFCMKLKNQCDPERSLSCLTVYSCWGEGEPLSMYFDGVFQGSVTKERLQTPPYIQVNNLILGYRLPPEYNCPGVGLCDNCPYCCIHWDSILRKYNVSMWPAGYNGEATLYDCSISPPDLNFPWPNYGLVNFIDYVEDGIPTSDINEVALFVQSWLTIEKEDY